MSDRSSVLLFLVLDSSTRSKEYGALQRVSMLKINNLIITQSKNNMHVYIELLHTNISNISHGVFECPDNRVQNQLELLSRN